MLGHMTKRTKIILSCLFVLAVFMVVSVFQQLRGFDASKKDPQKLFMFYVRNPIPRDVSVQSAVGHANFGGTFIKFRLKLSGKALDDLIAAKQLRSTDSLQPYLLSTNELSELKRPEFYWTDSDKTWSELGKVVKVAADRELGIMFYMVFSP